MEVNKVIDENAKFLLLLTASLIDSYHNEPILWDSNVNTTEK